MRSHSSGTITRYLLVFSQPSSVSLQPVKSKKNCLFDFPKTLKIYWLIRVLIYCVDNIDTDKCVLVKLYKQIKNKSWQKITSCRTRTGRKIYTFNVQKGNVRSICDTENTMSYFIRPKRR